MNTTDVQEMEWGDMAAEGLVAPTAGSRRRLLSGAAGGLVLATSGLFLPEWLAETEAREGALGGAKGGRRGKDHKGRHKKRSHGGKKEKGQDKPRGGSSKKLPIKFLVDLYGEHAPIKADYYSARLRPGLRDVWELKDSKSLAPSAAVSFAAADMKAALWLDDRIMVEVNNRLPLLTVLTIGHGGTFGAGDRGWEGGTVVFTDGLDVQAVTQAFVMEGYRIRVEHLADDEDHIRYHVMVNPMF